MRTILKGIAWAVATALLFLTAKDYATLERGYNAIGGEYLIPLIPLLYYIVKDTIKKSFEKEKKDVDK